MQTVAHLVAPAAEAEVSQGPAAQPGIDPVGEDPLVGPAELTCPGQHAAAVDPDREIEGFAVFKGEHLGCELGAAVEGNRRGGAERFS